MDDKYFAIRLVVFSICTLSALGFSATMRPSLMASIRQKSAFDRQIWMMSSNPSDASTAVQPKREANNGKQTPSPPSQQPKSKTADVNPLMVGISSTEGRPNLPVSFEDVSKAAHDIRGAVYTTPCARNSELSELTGCDLWLKVLTRPYR